MPTCQRCGVVYLNSEDHKCDLPKERRDPWPGFIGWFWAIVIYMTLSGLARACGSTAAGPNKEVSEPTAGEAVVYDDRKAPPTTVEEHARDATEPSDDVIRQFTARAKTSGDTEREVLAMVTAVLGHPPTDEQLRIIREELTK